MKRTLLFLAFCFVMQYGMSQIELMPNPSNINSGTFTFKYGEFGDYSIFDPLSNPNLYLYTGLQTDGDPNTWDYNDGEFVISNLGQMIPLTFDNALGYYVATFNPKTRAYFEEATQMVTNIPIGIEVFDWYFLITTDDLSRQSDDLRGTDYGFNASTVLSINSFNLNQDIVPLNGQIKFLTDGQFEIKVFDVLGKKIKDISLAVNSGMIHDLRLNSNGIYIVKISSGESTKMIKMLKH